MKNGLNENEFAVKITNLFMFFNAKNLYYLICKAYLSIMGTAS